MYTFGTTIVCRNLEISLTIKMVQRCVVKFCGNSDKTGHNIHKFPQNKALRRQWVRFVQVKRADFGEGSVTPYSVVCGAHFTKDSFRNSTQYELGFSPKRKLSEGVIPMLQPQVSSEDLEKEQATKRKFPPASTCIHTSHSAAATSTGTSATSSHDTVPKKSRAIHKWELARVR